MQAGAIIQALKIAQEQARRSGETFTHESPLAECGLDNVDCPVCHNTGCIITKAADGTLKAAECVCMAKRVSIRNLERSGLKDAINRYTFKNYVTDSRERQKVFDMAVDFCRQEKGWFFISGKSGSGKTHICTAICSRLMDAGKAVRYMRWRDDSLLLKALTTEGEEYQRMIQPFKSVPVLYIDDFLKGGHTEADIRLAFEILNSRYNDSALRTVISSELSLFEILGLDEATGGRIYERAKGFVIESPRENWRLKNG
jgi:DNA replication protein DnaC